MENKLRHVDPTTVMLQVQRSQQQNQATQVEALAIQTKCAEQSRHFKVTKKKPWKDYFIEPKNAVNEHKFF